MKSTSDDIEFLKNLKCGDRHALAQIFNKYWRGLYLYARKFTHDEYVADEIVQELFIRLWEKRSELAIQSLSQYLYRSVKNGCIDYARSQLNRDAEWDHYSKFFPTSTDSPEEEYLKNEVYERLNLLLDLLPKKSKAIFQKSKIEGLSVKQIAQMMKVSKKTVEYHITKANKLINSDLHEFILLIALSVWLLF